MKPAMMSIWSIFICACISMVLARAAHTKDSEYAAIDTTVSLLTSPGKAQQAEGEETLQVHGDEYLDILIKDLRSPMLSKRAYAAKLIRALVSPWARGILAGDKHHGHAKLFKPRRPTTRSALHPKAENIRQALLVSLDELLEQGHGIGTPETRKKLGPNQYTLIRDTITPLCLCLSEFGNDETAGHLSGILAKEENNRLCVPVMRCMETIYGLPLSFRGFGGFCGNISEEMANQILREQDARCEQEKASLVAWHEEHVKDNQDARIRAALRMWDGYFAPTDPHGHWQIFRWNPFVGSNGYWLLRFEHLIRMGEPVVPLLRDMQAATKDIESKANYEIVIAAITGRVDKAIVRELFAGSHPRIAMACAIIIAAGSTDWKEKLDGLQCQTGWTGKIASHTLAVCYRKSAINLLKKAAESNESNYIAKYAVLELQSWEE